MSKLDNQFKRNRLLQKIHFNDRSGNKEGFCKYYPNNSDLHEDTKWEVFKNLKKDGFELWSECRIGNLRADLFAIKEGKGFVVEILNSETDKMFELKKLKVPEEFTLIKVNVKDFNPKEFEI